MPHGSKLLPRFLRRESFDFVMFGYVMGMRSGIPKVLPGVSPEKAPKLIPLEDALTTFARDMGLTSEEFHVPTQVTRFNRMLKDFYNSQRTSKETTPKTD